MGAGVTKCPVDLSTASSGASRASGSDTPGFCGGPFSECFGKGLHWPGQTVYCQGCKPSLCVPLPPLTTGMPYAHHLTPGGSSPHTPHPQPYATGDSFLSSPSPSCHLLGAKGRRSPGQTHLTNLFFFFFPKPNYDGHRPRPEASKRLPV